MTDEELAGWARNWHWNDCASDQPVDPSIYFRDMRMLKAFIAKFGPAVREPLAWDAFSNRSYEPVETRAAEIYATFSFNGAGTKPAWLSRGNSAMQDEARMFARQELSAAGHSPPVSRPSGETP